MTIKIPNETKQFKQIGNSDVIGNIWSSFNLDLTENLGRIRVAGRGLLVDGSAVGETNMETPVAFEFFDNGTNERVWCIAGARMFYNSGDPDDSYTEDATASTPTDLSNDCDMKVFNNAIYVAGCGDLHKYAYGGTWSTVSTAPNGSECSMCIFGNRLYASQSTSQIFSVDTADVVTEPTSVPNTNLYTLQLSPFFEGKSDNSRIIAIRAASDRIWIATTNIGESQGSASGLRGRIYEWDGISVQPNKFYQLESLGALSLVIKDDVPYIVDTDGRLLKFNGSSFIEVARFPVNISKYQRNPANSNPLQRFIHPRGMEIRNGRIVMLVNNFPISTSTVKSIENLPSGVWEYDEEIGLYHKYSVSMSSVGFSTRSDYAQNKLEEVGALYYCKSTATTDNDGDLTFGAKYFTSDSATAYGVFVNNTKDDKSKIGYLVSNKIESQSVQDVWKKCFIKYKRLLDSSDRIVLKYRLYETTPVEDAVTWSSTTVFTSTGSFGSVEVGDEVEILRGTGGGQIEHITTISENAGTYTITLANAVIGATGTSTVRIQKWIKIGEFTNQNLDIGECPIGKSSNWIQLKLVMYFTGKDEVNELELVNSTFRPSV